MKISDVIQYLETLAPKSLQESYDNSGLLVGNAAAEVTKVLISLDITEAVVEEAVAKGCNLIVAHHPVIFGGLKSLTGKSHVERTVMAAIKSDVALYAIHTNLDNVQGGVNAKIGEKLGISNPQILAPKTGLLRKLAVYVPLKEAEQLKEALFAAGAGNIGAYSECSFSTRGEGSFRGSANSNPTIGEAGGKQERVEEVKLEVLVPAYAVGKVLKAMLDAHPYEEVAYDVYPLENTWQEVGSGMVGHLPEPMYVLDFLKLVKDTFGGVVRYTALVHDQVSKIAWCGGSGSFLLPQAKAAGAQVFITSDFKYHQFFDAENDLIIADIGHYENEQFTKELLGEKLKEKFPTFAVLFTETNTNPVNYL
jgi:dinuclear metal center YbgI/SA1388 family protein